METKVTVFEMLVTRPEIEIPYHLCPICGLSTDTTSRICSKHSNYTVTIPTLWRDGRGEVTKVKL